MRLSRSALLLVLIGPVAAAQPRADLPRFEDYPATDVYRGRPAPVDLASDPGAREYRTRLREGAPEGPNFAGHLTAVVWGCGTGCAYGAVVDARTGRVRFFPAATRNGGLAYRADSRLFVLDPPEDYAEDPAGDVPSWVSSTYYVWEDGRFRHLRTVSNVEIAEALGLPPPSDRGCRHGPFLDGAQFADCFWTAGVYDEELDRVDHGLSWCDIHLGQGLADVERAAGAALRLDPDAVRGYGASATARVCGRDVALTFDTADRDEARVRTITLGRDPADAPGAWDLGALRDGLHGGGAAATYAEGRHEPGTTEAEDDTPQYRLDEARGQLLLLKPAEGVIVLGFDAEFD